MRIYLDHNATTPVDPRVGEAMLPFWGEVYGNPSSLHAEGALANRALNEARESVARSLCCSPRELIFTSGGTEAINLALKGVWGGKFTGHLITTAIEHQAVLQSAKTLVRWGVEVTHLGVNATGDMDLEELRQAIRTTTRLISVMYANNEIGNIYPMEAIGQIARERNVLFHVDAVQALGKIPIDLSQLPVDLMSCSSHKIYGPKGVGLLFVRKGVELERLVDGGAQEMEKRGGTENIPGIVGMAKAIALVTEHLPSTMKHMTALRDQLEAALLQQIPGTHVHGNRGQRVCNTLNVAFDGITKETILMALDRAGVAVSAGSACASGAIEPSHVLLAMGVPLGQAKGAVRFSLGHKNTAAEIEETVRRVKKVVEALRG